MAPRAARRAAVGVGAVLPGEGEALLGEQGAACGSNLWPDLSSPQRRAVLAVLALAALALGVVTLPSALAQGGLLVRAAPAPAARAPPAQTGTVSLQEAIPAAAVPVASARALLDNCLCLFDVDRTLTAMQSSSGEQCPSAMLVDGVFDPAFATGTLKLSEVSQNIQSTFCARCYRGVISAGSAGGDNSQERTEILNRLGGIDATLSSTWSGPNPVVSPLVIGAPDGFKQDAARGVVNWFASQGVQISDSNVHFFDDRDGNVPPFQGTGFNARQVSCGARDGIVGACGASFAEIVPDTGVVSCQGPV